MFEPTVRRSPSCDSLASFVQRAAALLVALALTSVSVQAGSTPTNRIGDRWTLRNPRIAASTGTAAQQQQQRQQPTRVQPDGWTRSFIELGLSNESFELGYRSLTSREDGYFGFDLIANEDDDFAIDARLIRVGQIVGVPVRLGVGIGAFGVFFDEPDETAYAITLTGIAEYDVVAAYPTVLRGELSVAPDITTFSDGEDLLDFRLRLNVEISQAAAAFVGIHILEVETKTDSREVVDGIHIGVRIGL